METTRTYQNIAEFLESKNIHFRVESGGSEFRINCPSCHHKNNKFYINVYGEGFYCFHCGLHGSLKGLLELLGGKDNVEINIGEPSKAEPDLPPIDLQIVEDNHRSLVDGTKCVDVRKYLYERGLNDETIEKFKLGWDGRNLTIPVVEGNGDYVNFRLRSDPTRPNSNHGLFSIPGRGRHRLFNEQILKTKPEQLIIAEGEWDCMLLTQLGYAAITSTGGAKSFKSEWTSYLKGIEKIYFCFDNDFNKTGQTGALRTAKLFQDQGIQIANVKLPDPLGTAKKVDITDYFIKLKKTKEDFDKLLQEAEDFDSDELVENENPPALIRIFPWREFIKTKFEDPKWVVENLIPQNGLVAVAGSPESLKSFFSIYIAIKVAQGESVLDKFEITKTSVLIIDQESIPAWLHKRLTGLSKAEDLPIYIFDKDKTSLDLLDGNIFNQLLDFIKDNKVGLVIIDTLRMAHSKEENSSTEMKPVIDRLKQLTPFTAIVFIHHHRKTDKFSRGKSTGEDMMGSNFIRGAVDYQLTLTNLGEQDDGGTRVRVAQTKARYTRTIKSFEMSLVEDQDGLLTFAYKGEVEDEKLKKADAKERIKELLAEEDIKRQDIIDQLDDERICKSRTSEEALKELVTECVIKHTRSTPHVYSLVENQTPNDSANRNTIESLRNAESELKD